MAGEANGAAPVANGASGGGNGPALVNATPGGASPAAGEGGNGPAVSTASGAPRGPNGKFAPRNGAAEPAEGERKAEKPPEYRFKRKLNLYGKEEDVDLGEDDLAREVQIARAARLKLKELKQREDKLAEFDKLPEALFDSEDEALEFSKRFLAARARRELMPPEEARALEVDERERRFLEEKQAWEESRANEERRARAVKQWEQIAPEIDSALEEAGLERTSKELEAVADIGLEFLDAKLPLSPKDLVKEFARREETGFRRRLGTLEPQRLRASLSDEQWAGLRKLMVDEYKAKHSGFEPKPKLAPSPPKDEPRRYVSEAEFKKLMRGR
jgi:hypothetical protein